MRVVGEGRARQHDGLRAEEGDGVGVHGALVKYALDGGARRRRDAGVVEGLLQQRVEVTGAHRGVRSDTGICDARPPCFTTHGDVFGETAEAEFRRTLPVMPQPPQRCSIQELLRITGIAIEAIPRGVRIYLLPLATLMLLVNLPELPARLRSDVLPLAFSSALPKTFGRGVRAHEMRNHFP
jgi:hypothetical protein